MKGEGVHTRLEEIRNFLPRTPSERGTGTDLVHLNAVRRWAYPICQDGRGEAHASSVDRQQGRETRNRSELGAP